MPQEPRAATGPTADASPGTRGSPRRPAGGCARRRSSPKCECAPNGSYSAPSHSASRSDVSSGPIRSSPPPMTRRGTSATTRRSTDTPGQHLASRRPGLVRLLAEQVLDPQDVGQGQVAVVAQQSLGERLPADHAAAVDLGDVAQLVRAGGWPQVARQLRPDQHEAGDRHALRGLERQQPAHPVPDRRRSSGPSRSRAATTSSVYVSNDSVGRIRGLRPEVIAQVQGMALPSHGPRSTRGTAPRPTSRRARRGRTGAACGASGARAATTRCTGRGRAARSRPCARAGR